MKKLFLSIKDELVFGGHIMSLGSASLVGAYSLVLGYRVDFLYLLITYLGVHSIYLFDRYKEAKTDLATNPERAAYVEKHRKMIEKMIIGYVASSFMLIAMFCGYKVMLCWLLMYVFGFAYGLFFKKLSRKIVSFKNLFVAFVYVFLLFSYHIYAKVAITTPAILLMVFAYLRLYATEVFYDLKDIEEDKKKGLKTLAVVLSRDNYFRVINLINFVSGIPLVLAVFLEYLPSYSLILLMLLPYYSQYSNKLHTKGNITRLSYIYCDGEYLLWLPLVFLTKFMPIIK